MDYTNIHDYMFFLQLLMHANQIHVNTVELVQRMEPVTNACV